MNLGVLVRADNRGLGIQTWEVYRHLKPAKTLVILGDKISGYKQYPERYPDAWRAVPAERMFPDIVKDFCAGLDLVWSAETFYESHFYDIAHEMGVKTVLQANPEFYPYERKPNQPRPGHVWTATRWRLGHMPGARVVPHPVAVDRLQPTLRTGTRFLHLAGHPAMKDRAGTKLVMQALQYVKEPCTVIIRSQVPVETKNARPARCVSLQLKIGDHEDYWEPYAEADILLAPRRYGGLSLPLQEALGSGMAVIATQRVPEEDYPVFQLPIYKRDSFHGQPGLVEIESCDPRKLAEAMDKLTLNPPAVEVASSTAIRWAETHSWDALLPVWQTELAQISS